MARAAAGASLAHRGHRRGALPARIRAAIYQDLAWLGIGWEEPVRRQSEHFDDYRAALAQARCARAGLSELREPRRDCAAGRRADSARSLAARSRRRAALSRPRPRARRPSAAGASRPASPMRCGSTWRRRSRATARSPGPRPGGPDGETGTVAAAPAAWGDVVLARKETPTSYHLAVVVDDALQGVTEVVRGQDLFWATSVHRLLQALLGPPAPRLPPSPADPRRRRPKAVEIDARHRAGLRCETAARPTASAGAAFSAKWELVRRAFRLGERSAARCRHGLARWTQTAHFC